MTRDFNGANVIYIYVVITSIQTRCIASWLNCRCYNVAWMSNVHVLITLITRRCEDVGFGCRLDFNVVATSNFHVLVTSMTLRKRCICVVRRRNVYATNNQRHLYAGWAVSWQHDCLSTIGTCAIFRSVQTRHFLHLMQCTLWKLYNRNASTSSRATCWQDLPSFVSDIF